MRRIAFFLALLGCPPATTPPNRASTVPEQAPCVPAPVGTRTAVHDLDQLELPFGWVPLSQDYVRAYALRKVVMHRDFDADEGRYRDVEVDTLSFDRDGRLVSKETLDRGKVSVTVAYGYDAGKLVRVAHFFPDAPANNWSEVRSYDGEGRLSEVAREDASGRSSERRTYDPAGNVLVERGEGDTEERLSRTFEEGKVVKEELTSRHGKIVTTMKYDAAGRLAQRTTKNAQGRVDDYRFAHDGGGRLTSFSFAENDKPIFRRTYAYDEEGRLIRERLESFVPAMGKGQVTRYEYERHGDPVSLTPAPAERQASNEEVTKAVAGAFPGAYPDLATLTYEHVGGGRHVLKSVTFFVPEAVLAKHRDAALKGYACDAKKALGHSCDCESVTRGRPMDHAWHAWPDKRVVPVTLDLALGC